MDNEYTSAVFKQQWWFILYYSLFLIQSNNLFQIGDFGRLQVWIVLKTFFLVPKMFLFLMKSCNNRIISKMLLFTQL